MTNKTKNSLKMWLRSQEGVGMESLDVARFSRRTAKTLIHGPVLSKLNTIPSRMCDYGCYLSSSVCLAWVMADERKLFFLKGGEVYKGVPSHFPYMGFGHERR